RTIPSSNISTPTNATIQPMSPPIRARTKARCPQCGRSSPMRFMVGPPPAPSPRPTPHRCGPVGPVLSLSGGLAAALDHGREAQHRPEDPEDPHRDEEQGAAETRVKPTAPRAPHAVNQVHHGAQRPRDDHRWTLRRSPGQMADAGCDPEGDRHHEDPWPVEDDGHWQLLRRCLMSSSATIPPAAPPEPGGPPAPPLGIAVPPPCAYPWPRPAARRCPARGPPRGPR